MAHAHPAFSFSQSQYHPYCPIDWGNVTSEQNCWLGDTNVTLPDLNTQNPTVISTYSSWIQDLVSTYNFDGLRIDGQSPFFTPTRHPLINHPSTAAKYGNSTFKSRLTLMFPVDMSILGSGTSSAQRQVFSASVKSSALISSEHP